MSSGAHLPRRQMLKLTGLAAAGAGLRAPAGAAFALFQEPAAPEAPEPLGRALLLQGLDGLCRVGGPDQDSFADGHGASAVTAAVEFHRVRPLDAETQQALRALLDRRILVSPIYAPHEDEPADPKLLDGILTDLEASAGTHHGASHSLIFGAHALRALRELPEALTPARARGLRATMTCLGTETAPAAPAELRAQLPGLDEPPAFARFVFEEHLRALAAYREGHAHHGFAGHLLTIASALCELRRLGHHEIARKGLAAYAHFVHRARTSPDLGRSRVAEAPAQFARPWERDYWIEQARRSAGAVVRGHMVKYPASWCALLGELDDPDLKARVEASIFHLTAVS